MISIIDVRKEKENCLYRKLLDRNAMDYKKIQDSVDEILRNVRLNGDKAIIEYTKTFDRVDLTPEALKVADEEIERAYEAVDSQLLEIIRRAKRNIEAFHEKQKENSWFSTEDGGVILGQLYRPLEVVGVYVPGGTAPLISSVLMNAVPARVAGVKKIIMATPPGRDKGVNPAIVVAAKEAGVDEIYRMGGAQAIAALAYGTRTVPKVDKIVGPGNIYVATAKRMVYGYCDIDMVAGPSEILVVADESADPAYVAADLLSQAEHDVMASSILLTTSEALANQVAAELERQMEYLSRKDIMTKALNDFGAIIIVNDLFEAVDMVNRIAPEHLELCIKEPFGLLSYIKNAGAIFLGHYSSEPLGDYFAGPNHVLPTSGTARFFSPLNVGDFIKKSSVIFYTRQALEKVKDDVVKFAEAEGLDAHANAIKVRFDK